MSESQATLAASKPAPKPPKPEVTVTNKEKETYELMERRDEDQITRQLQGEIVDEFFYSFKAGNREVTGLSWVGIKECAQRLGNIKLELVNLTENDVEYRVIIKATNLRNNLDAFGNSTQSKTDKFTKKPDEFAFQKAMSKAQRNAIRNLLPEKMIATMLKKFSEGKKAK